MFPVSYNDRFYLDVLESGELVSEMFAEWKKILIYKIFLFQAKLAYYNDIVVGAVCCRIDFQGNQRRLYIMTLGCLYPYRRLGIGSVMLNHILQYVGTTSAFDNIFL